LKENKTYFRPLVNITISFFKTFTTVIKKLSCSFIPNLRIEEISLYMIKIK